MHRIAGIIFSVSLIRLPQFHNEALDFATKFEEVELPANLPAVRARTKVNFLFWSNNRLQIYKGSRINLVLAVSVLLVHGLKDYASIIHL